MIGHSIKELRKKKKLTQPQLCNGTISKSMISQIENNLTSPSLKTLTQISKTLEVPVSYFLDGHNSNKLQIPLDELQDIYSNFEKATKNNNYEKSRSLYHKIVNTFDLKMNHILIAEINDAIADYLIRGNKTEEARSFIENAKNIYKENRMYIALAKSHLNLYFVHLSNYELQLCLEVISEAEDLYALSPKRDSVFEIDVFLRKSVHISTFNEDPKLDEDEILSIIELSLKSNMYALAELYSVLSFSNACNSNFKDHRKNIEKAKKISKLGSSLKFKSILLIEALGYKLANNHPKAIEVLYNALNLDCDNDDTILSRYLIHIELIKSLSVTSDLKECKTILLDVCNTPELKSSPVLYQKIFYFKHLLSIVDIVSDILGNDVAIDHTLSLIKLIKNTNLRNELYVSYTTLGKLYYQVKEYEKSHEAYEEAIKYSLSIRND